MPTIAITTPAANAFVRGTFAFNATASDASGITRVKFFRGTSTLLLDDTVAPYGVSVATTGLTPLANGVYTLLARAFDGFGNTTDTSISVTVDNTLPTVALTAPATTSRVTGIVTLSANASDALSGVARVEFYRGTTLIGTSTTAPYSVTWDTGPVVNGAQSLTAKAFDRAGNAATSGAISVTVDHTAPTVSVATPAEAARVSGTVNATITATDNVGVARVELYAAGTLIGSDTSSPFAVSWNTRTSADGSVALTAKAYDSAGNIATSAVRTVNVENVAPTVSITSPAAGAAVRGTVVVNATASDASGITRVKFFRGTTLLLDDTVAPYSASFATTGTTPLANGNYTLRAQAFDAHGNMAEASATITVDNTVPTASLSSPVAGAKVRGTVTLTANASDALSGVARVEFYRAGTTLIGTATTSPYSVTWDTTALANGAQSITVKAFDRAGNGVTSVAVSVTVDNTAPTVSLSAPVANATLRGTATLTASATDNVAVVRVEFYDGATRIGTDTVATPWSFAWLTTAVANGAHTLTAKAFDAAGNSTTSAVVNVTIAN